MAYFYWPSPIFFLFSFFLLPFFPFFSFGFPISLFMLPLFFLSFFSLYPPLPLNSSVPLSISFFLSIFRYFSLSLSDSFLSTLLASSLSSSIFFLLSYLLPPFLFSSHFSVATHFSLFPLYFSQSSLNSRSLSLPRFSSRFFLFPLYQLFLSLELPLPCFFDFLATSQSLSPCSRQIHPPRALSLSLPRPLFSPLPEISFSSFLLPFVSPKPIAPPLFSISLAELMRQRATRSPCPPLFFFTLSFPSLPPPAPPLLFLPRFPSALSPPFSLPSPDFPLPLSYPSSHLNL